VTVCLVGRSGGDGKNTNGAKREDGAHDFFYVKGSFSICFKPIKKDVS
jgi:hypothetical protein